MAIGVHVSFLIGGFVFSIYKLGEEFLDHISSSIFILLSNFHNFFPSCCTHLHSHEQRIRFSFLTSLPTFVIYILFNDSHSDRCEVVSHFDLHFSNNWWCWASFHVPVICLYVFFGKMFIQIFCPFFWLRCLFFLILSCMICLHILDINLLSILSFENIFFYSIGWLFLLLMISFAVQNLLN